MKTRILVVVIVASPVHCTRGLSLRNPSQHPIQAVEPLHGITRGVCLPVHQNSGHRLVIRIPPKLNMYRYLPPGLFDERDTLSEAVVLLRTVVTFVTWLLSRTEFFRSITTFFVDVRFQRFGRRDKVVASFTDYKHV